MRECIVRQENVITKHVDLKNCLQAWRRRRGVALHPGALAWFLNEHYGLPQSNREWANLSLLPQDEWKTTLLFESVSARTQYQRMPDPVSEYECNFLRALAKSRSDYYKTYIPISIEPLKEIGTALDDLINKQELELWIAKHAPARGMNIGDMLLFHEISVGGCCYADAVKTSRHCGFEPSLSDSTALYQAIKSNSPDFPEHRSKCLGNILVLVEVVILGWDPRDAVQRVRGRGFKTVSPSTIYRWELDLIGRKGRKRATRVDPSFGKAISIGSEDGSLQR